MKIFESELYINMHTMEANQTVKWCFILGHKHFFLQYFTIFIKIYVQVWRKRRPRTRVGRFSEWKCVLWHVIRFWRWHIRVKQNIIWIFKCYTTYSMYNCTYESLWSSCENSKQNLHLRPLCYYWEKKYN